MRWNGFPVRGLAGVLLALPILVAFATLVEIVHYGSRMHAEPADAAVVLGAAVYGEVPSPVFEERLRHAVGLYWSGVVRKLVMTGGRSSEDRLSEAEAARA